MDSIKILKKLKLIETLRLAIENEKSKIFKKLKMITDVSHQHFSARGDKTESTLDKWERIISMLNLASIIKRTF